MPKQLWTYQVAQRQRLEFSIFFSLVVIATIYYFYFYSIFKHIPTAIYALLFGYIASTINYFLLLQPAVQTEKSICRDLREQHHFLADDQNISVGFSPNGENIEEIFYQDASYKKRDGADSLYQIYSNPKSGNPQIHFVRVGNWTEESFAVVTEKQAGGPTLCTVYNYRPKQALS